MVEGTVYHEDAAKVYEAPVAANVLQVTPYGCSLQLVFTATAPLEELTGVVVARSCSEAVGEEGRNEASEG